MIWYTDSLTLKERRPTMGKQKFKVGDKFKVKSNHNGHNYQIGQIYTVTGRQQGGYYMGNDPSTGFNGNWIMHTEIEPALVTAKELEEQRAALLVQVAEVDTKLAFLKETGLEAFDADEYKIHRSLQVLDNTSDPVARAKALAKLFREIV